MRSFLLSLLTISVLGLSVFLRAGSTDQSVKIRLQLTDAGQKTSGLIRLREAQKTTYREPVGLYDRLKGLGKTAPGKGWYVVPSQGGELTLPVGKYTIEAISGLESRLTQKEIKVTPNTKTITLPLEFVFRPENENLVAGNTHLHLRNMTLPQADEYLRTIPSVDRLKVLFISHLRRHKDDETYITNEYPLGDLKQFDVTGVLINNGEEHRHNFTGFGQGYGHVMLLDIKRLIQPVSIGPGIMKTGFDDQPLRVGIDDAHKQGGTVIWCHNTFGYEDVLNAMTNRLDALNVYDGSRAGKYEDNYYRYLNMGVHVPLSTGTDWFLYDFSRVYAQVSGPLTIKSWLQAVKAGRCQATNGPLLSLQVNGRSIGDIIELKKPQSVMVQAQGVGRQNFQRLELVHNGKVIQTQTARKKAHDYTAKIQCSVRIDEPGWLALRIGGKEKNELGRVLYAHTSPIYLRLGGKDRFDVEAARGLLEQLEEGKAAIQSQGQFSHPQARERILALFDEGMRKLTEQINQKK